MVKRSMLNLPNISCLLLIYMNSIHKTYFAAMNDDTVKMKPSFRSNYVYNIFCISVLGISIFLDPILGIRMVLLRPQLQLNCILLKQLAVVEKNIIHTFDEMSF